MTSKRARWPPLFITFLSSSWLVTSVYQVLATIYVTFFYYGITLSITTLYPIKCHNLYDPSLQHFSLEEEYVCTSLERTAPPVEQQPNPCLVGSEEQINTPAFQHRTSDDIKKHNRQIQTVTSRCTCTETKTSRGASQSNLHFQFQVKFMILTRHNFASFLCFTISEYARMLSELECYYNLSQGFCLKWNFKYEKCKSTSKDL